MTDTATFDDYADFDCRVIDYETGDAWLVQGHLSPMEAAFMVVVYTMRNVGRTEAHQIVFGSAAAERGWGGDWNELRPLLEGQQHRWYKVVEDDDEYLRVCGADDPGAMAYTCVQL